MAFYPEGLAIPREWRTEDLWLRVLRPDVTELDYEALMESRERLRRWSDSTWPADDFTLAENRADLFEHEREWEASEAFAYTVLSPDGNRCEGCVYIDPFLTAMLGRGVDPGAALPDADDETPVVTYWVRETALARGLDRQLLAGLRSWFATEWPFRRAIYRINDHQERDRQLLNEAGLVHLTSHPSRVSPLMWRLYTEP